MPYKINLYKTRHNYLGWSNQEKIDTEAGQLEISKKIDKLINKLSSLHELSPEYNKMYLSIMRPLIKHLDITSPYQAFSQPCALDILSDLKGSISKDYVLKEEISISNPVAVDYIYKTLGFLSKYQWVDERFFINLVRQCNTVFTQIGMERMLFTDPDNLYGRTYYNNLKELRSFGKKGVTLAKNGYLLYISAQSSTNFVNEG